MHFINCSAILYIIRLCRADIYDSFNHGKIAYNLVYRRLCKYLSKITLPKIMLIFITTYINVTQYIARDNTTVIQ